MWGKKKLYNYALHTNISAIDGQHISPWPSKFAKELKSPTKIPTSYWQHCHNAFTRFATLYLWYNQTYCAVFYIKGTKCNHDEYVIMFIISNYVAGSFPFYYSVEYVLTLKFLKSCMQRTMLHQYLLQITCVFIDSLWSSHLACQSHSSQLCICLLSLQPSLPPNKIFFYKREKKSHIYIYSTGPEGTH